MKTRPKILCLTGHNTSGPDYGAALRSRHVFRLLARLGDVRVILAADDVNPQMRPPKELDGLELLDAVNFPPAPRWSLTERFRNEFDASFLNSDCRQARRADRERLDAWMAAHDLVWIHGLKLANRYGLWRWPKSVLDLDDIPSGLYRTRLQQAASLFERFRWRRQAALWRQREKLLDERFDAICICSEHDRRELPAAKNLFVLPNGFTAASPAPVRRPVTPPCLGFVGTFNYAPNRQGVQWFVAKVWPLILARLPAARLRLAGAGTDREAWSGAKNLEPLGFVPDLAAEMGAWSASIVPLFVGGGTRIKIAEAFSRQCPVVSTSLGAYGYEVADGCELWLADSPADFADKCLRALTDPAQGRLLAGRAWEKFQRLWTWDAQAGRVAEVVNSVLKAS